MIISVPGINSFKNIKWHYKEIHCSRVLKREENDLLIFLDKASFIFDIRQDRYVYRHYFSFTTPCYYIHDDV